MKTVLVLTVGGSAEPLLHAIQHSREVAHVYFLCSTGPAGSDRTIEQLHQNQIRGRCTHCGKDYTQSTELQPVAVRAGLSKERYTVVPIEDPDELPCVHEACRTVADDISRRFEDEPVEVVANYTGGTKTMSLGLGNFALRQGKDWVLQTNVRGSGRDNLVKITSGDVPTLQDTTSIEAEVVRGLARTLIERHDFEGAAALLQGYLAGTRLPRETKRDLLTEVNRYQLLAACDRLDFPEAERIGQLLGEGAEVRKARDLNRICVELTASDAWRAKNLTGLELVAEVLESARRRVSIGHYDDAAARLYRATELLAQVRLKRYYNVVTSNVEYGHLPLSDAAKARLEAGREAEGGPIKIGLMEGYRLLRDLGDPLGEHASGKRLDALKNFIEKRNFSFLAHGTNPISRERWEEFGARWLAWLEEACQASARPAAALAR